MTKLIHNEYAPDLVSPPRETLRELLEERGMPQAELAKRMDKTTKAVNEILSDQSDVAITPDTALQLEQALGLPARFWLKREQAYREALARIREREQHEKQVDWLDCLPIADLRKRGHIRATRKGPDMVREALAFFRVTSVEGWKLVWSTAEVAYRLSDAFDSELGHLASWLQCGEIAASKIRCGDYDQSAFEAVLPGLRALTRSSIEELTTGIVRECAAAGVAVVFVPEFPKTHVCGAARWIQGGRRPLIALSLRYKSDDHFWFTLFHEACHILKHAKKTIYVDDKNPDGGTIEEEANRFARNVLIPEAAYRQFTAGRDKFFPDVIEGFAELLGIAPGMVVGRLQHDGLLDQKFGNALKRRFAFSADGTVVDKLAS